MSDCLFLEYVRDCFLIAFNQSRGISQYYKTMQRVWMNQPNKMVEAHLIELNENATQLYEKAVADGATNTLDPVNWLANEDSMRAAYIKLFDIDNPMLRSIMCNPNNSLYVYMKFMCDSYPRGFGNACKNSAYDGSSFDGCETFVRLGGKAA